MSMRPVLMPMRVRNGLSLGGILQRLGGAEEHVPIIQPANNGAITEFGRTRDQFSPSSNSPRSRPGCASSWRAGRSISASAGTAWRHWCSRRYVRTRFVGDVFVFRVKRADRVKILAWDGTGLCLFHKRLEKGHFVWPPVQDGRFA